MSINALVGSSPSKWADEIAAIRNEGTTVLNEIKAQLSTNARITSNKQLMARSKLRTAAVPLMEKIVEVYGNGAKLLSNPPEYDVCLKLDYGVELILNTEKDVFTARYHFPLDGEYKVEGVILIEGHLYPEIPISEENVKKVMIKFLAEYNQIIALKEKRKLAEQKAEQRKQAVIVTC